MGVRGLETYVEREVPHAVVKVNMEQQIREYNITHNKKPLIVIDIGTLAFIWSVADDSTFGIRANITIKKCTKFFQRFKDAGATLAFSEGGPIQTPKKDTFIQRRTLKRNEKLAVLQAIDSGVPLAEITQKHVNRKGGSGSSVPLIKECARKFGEVFTPSIGEKHTQIAAYAKKNRAFAILAKDTNYLIHVGPWHYWNVDSVNFFEFTVKQFNTALLRDKLGLTEQQMPLFATLAGNEIMMFEKLQPFHGPIGLNRRYAKVASYVQKIRLPLGNQGIQYVVNHVFRSSQDKNECIKMMQNSLKMYDLSKVEMHIYESDPFLKKLLHEDDNHHYQVLKNCPAIIVSSYLDLTEQDFCKPFGELALVLERRLMGILWQHKESENLKRQFYIRMACGRDFEVLEFDAEYPSFHIPPLEKLLLRNEGDGLDNERFKMIKWIFGNGLNVDRLFKLDAKYVPTIALLHYFVKEAGIEIKEADIFLSSIFDAINDRVPKDIQMPEKLNPRAFRIVFLYLKLHRIILRIFSAIGLTKYATYAPFDGLHFHVLWQEWEKMSSDSKKERIQSIENMRLYLE